MRIQSGHPKIKSTTTAEFASVQDVFFEVFREKEEVLYLFWHEIPIAMRYQQDISLSFNDMLAMVWMLEKDEEGKTSITLYTELFKVTLKLHWEQEVIDIVPHFEAYDDLYESYVDVLNKHEYVTMRKESFINEWNGVLRQLLIALTVSKATVKEGTEKRKLSLFQKLVNNMENYGQVYTN